MTAHDIQTLNRLAVEGAAALTPIATNGSTDSHGGRVEPTAVSVARGLLALEQAGSLAQRTRRSLEASERVTNGLSWLRRFKLNSKRPRPSFQPRTSSV